MSAKEVLDELNKSANPEKAKLLAGYFKTGKGEYGEGDIFIGLTLPQIRIIVKKYRELPLTEVKKLVKNKVHEVRMAGVLLLVENYKEYPDEVFKIYISHTKYINNWDLVDVTCNRIIGKYLEDKPRDLLVKFANSDLIWERRMAIMATFEFIYKGESEETFKIAEILINDKHDLIQKAVGWMLREVGKRVSQDAEEEFLDKYAPIMPRTMLRYAIEKFSEEKRQRYLKKI